MSLPSKIFQPDTPKQQVAFGIAVVVGLELVAAVLVMVVCLIAKISLAENPKWMAAIFIAPVFMLRHYAKKQTTPTLTKSMIISLFVTFIVFIAILL